MKITSQKSKVLVVSHGASATGFSRVADGIIRSLKDSYDFYQFATNHKNESIEGAWDIYGNPDITDMHGLNRLDHLIKTIKPQIVLLLNDLWFCCMHIERIIKSTHRPITIAYCPVDGILTRPNIYSSLAHFDQIVPYNFFGKQELEKIQHNGSSLSKYSLYEKMTPIPHGLDPSIFYPLQTNDLLDSSAAKREFFKGTQSENGFIVLNASKHQLRKRIDLTIEGFSLFAKDKPDNVKLYLHSGATFDGPDLRGLVQRFGITDRLIHSPGWLKDHPAISEGKLNLLYNATDVGINSSMGEGWGLVSFEHAATAAPQIVPNHTACKELWQNVDTVLPIKKETEEFGLCMQRKIVSPKDIADMLNKLYLNSDFRKEQATKALKNACQPMYHWDKIALDWNALFQKLLIHKKISSNLV